MEYPRGACAKCGTEISGLKSEKELRTFHNGTPLLTRLFPIVVFTFSFRVCADVVSIL